MLSYIYIIQPKSYAKYRENPGNSQADRQTGGELDIWLTLAWAKLKFMHFFQIESDCRMSDIHKFKYLKRS